MVPASVAAGRPETDVPSLLAALKAGSVTALEKIPSITSGIIAAAGDAMKTASAEAFQTVYLTSIAFGGLAIVAAFFTSSIDDLLTDHVARKLRNTDSRVTAETAEKV